MKLMLTVGIQGSSVDEIVGSVLESHGINCVNIVDPFEPGDSITITVLEDGTFKFDLSSVHTAKGQTEGVTFSQR